MDILTRMKNGDKDYRAMLPCFYVEKTSEVTGCALVTLRPKNDSIKKIIYV